MGAGNLSDLTLIMPTYCRHEYALRGMHYWSTLGVRLIVLDGSGDPLPSERLGLIGPSVSYLHSAAGMYERIRSALPYIKTPYAALISDDEFFLENGILAAIDFLNINKDYIACGGQAVAFWCGDNGDVLSAIEYPRHKGFDLSGDLSGARVIKHFSNYMPATIYSIARAGFFVEAFSLVTKREFNAYALGELQYELFAAWCGKIKLLDNVYWMRSHENQPVRGTDRSLCLDRPVEEWWVNEGMRPEVEDFLCLTAREMVRVSDGAVDQAKEVIIKAMRGYFDFLNKCIQKQNTHQGRSDVLSKLKIFVANKIPILIGKKNKKIETKKTESLIEVLSHYDQRVADLARPDLYKIRDFLISWYSRNN